MATVTERGLSVSAKEVVIVGAAGVGLIVLLYWLAKREAKAAAGAVGDAASAAAKAVAPVVEKVNPFDQNNVLATAANAIYKTASGKPASDSTTLATWLTDFTWVNDYDPNEDLKKKVGVK